MCTVTAHLGRSDGASRVHPPNEGRHLRHTGPGLDEKSQAAREGGLPLLRHHEMLVHS